MLVRRALVVLAVLWALLAYLWMPTWTLWLAHFAALETLLGGAVVAAIALVAGRPWAWRAHSRTGRALVIAAGVALLASSWPLIAAMPVFDARDASFSMSRYVMPGDTSTVTRRRDLVVEPSRPDLTVDMLPGSGPGPHPFVIVVHGGSWRHGEKGEVPHVSRAIAEAGITVFDVSYRLAPEHTFPAGVADVKCLLGRLRAQSSQWNIDPARAAILGRSAGAQMAALVAYTAGAPEIAPACEVADDPVSAVVALYGVYDLVDGYENPIIPNVVDGTESLRLYLGGSPEERPEAYRLASPLSWISADEPLPPSLVIHGELDRCVRTRHSTKLADALTLAGQPVDLLLVPLAEHGFDHRAGGIGNQLALETILAFLAGSL